ncbi:MULTISPECIES: hypothetical protein [Micromonospora]|uniref:hypothetical protein n=1 Tax=Micromonospora TaxID=1873 RepID=UPI000B889F76|nr:hypothetical protein [Micromonospora yangpuensis]GGL99059.1 hypothetical protein GCM10012279_15590 [Micromonospora yangpuensis]
MAESEPAVLAEILQSAEDAAPVEAVEAVTGAVARALRQREVHDSPSVPETGKLGSRLSPYLRCQTRASIAR